MAKILILGGGFGGVIAVETLSHQLGTAEHQITLVSPQRTFTFYPALVRLAFGHLKSDEITFDLLARLNALNVRFVQGEALEIETEPKTVRIAGNDFNGNISYDFLLIAPGRRLATEQISGFFDYAHHLLGVESALKFGNAVKNFQSGRIVVGLSPNAYLPVPVCETAFALAKTLRNEIADGKISVSVVFPGTIEEAFGGANLHHKLERALESHQIKIEAGFPIKEIEEKKIISVQKNTLDYDLLMLVPPFKGQMLLNMRAWSDERGFIRTDNFMRVENLANVYAVGDIVAFPGPKLAYMAARQAQTAAENICSEINGGAAAKLYHHEIASIIDEGGADTIFLHYGIWDKTLYHLKEGAMWSRMKNKHNQLWDIVNRGFQKI